MFKVSFKFLAIDPTFSIPPKIYPAQPYINLPAS